MDADESVHRAIEQLPEGLRARVKAAIEVAKANSAEAGSEMAPSMRDWNARLRINISQVHRRRVQRVMMIHRIVDEMGSVISKHAACRRRCSHCCHIGVTISSTEARILAKASKRPLRDDVTMDLREGSFEDYSKPCPFLVRGECSVYEARPIACRAHYNMDSDETLCRLRSGVQVPVPYADMTIAKAAMVMTCEKDVFADIRDFFGEESPETGKIND